MRHRAFGYGHFGRRSARIRPHLRIGLKGPVGGPDQRFGQESRIVDVGHHGQIIAVPDPHFGQGGVGASRHAVAPQIGRFEVRGGRYERIALPDPRGESLPGMAGVFGWMGAAVHVDRSLHLHPRHTGANGDKLLRVRIEFFPDPHGYGQAAHGIVAPVGPALILLDRGNPVGMVAVGPHPGGFVDRQLEVVSKCRSGQSFGRVLVVQRDPIAGEIDLCDRCHARQQQARHQADYSMGAIQASHLQTPVLVSMRSAHEYYMRRDTTSAIAPPVTPPARTCSREQGYACAAGGESISAILASIHARTSAMTSRGSRPTVSMAGPTAN